MTSEVHIFLDLPYSNFTLPVLGSRQQRFRFLYTFSTKQTETIHFRLFYKVNLRCGVFVHKNAKISVRYVLAKLFGWHWLILRYERQHCDSGTLNWTVFCLNLDLEQCLVCYMLMQQLAWVMVTKIHRHWKLYFRPNLTPASFRITLEGWMHNIDRRRLEVLSL